VCVLQQQQMFNCSMLNRNNVQQHEAVSSTPLAREELQYSSHLTESVNNEKQRSRRRHQSSSSSQETAPKHRNPDRRRCRARFVDRDGRDSRDSSISTKAEVEAAVVTPQHRNVAAEIHRMEVVHPRSICVADAVDVEITPRHRRALDRIVVT